MTDKWNFECTQCGACCRAIACKYLTKDNLCSIYESRPFICNTKKVFDATYNKTMTKEEYFGKAKIACGKLQQLYP
tara:strand:- start:1634 stop:1861 length:228 start_codon:yes stop_codon:yes gene_type:complete